MYENYQVLFVDDEPNILSSLKRGLIDEEYHCLFASSGAKALEIMDENEIAVIVSDMRMPEMDGLHLLREVKERWPKTVRIVLSGYTQLQQILATINQADIFKFITKPWKLEEEFKHAIWQALDYYILVEESEKTKKALASKNTAYQNILKTMDISIAKEKERQKHIINCANAIFSYNKEVNGVSTIITFAIQEKVFSSLAKSLMADDKEYRLSTLEDTLTTKIQSHIELSNKEMHFDGNQKVNTNIGLVEAVILSVITIFRDEFQAYGLYLNYHTNPNNHFSISLVTKNLFTFQEESLSDILIRIDEKMDFMNQIFKHILYEQTMELYAARKEGNIVFIITIPIDSNFC